MKYRAAYEEYTREPRTTTFNRAPRRSNRAQELADRYSEYTNMGFTAEESRRLAYHHHSNKL
jgi:hypothetical protein